jgi:hypothetical protein
LCKNIHCHDLYDLQHRKRKIINKHVGTSTTLKIALGYMCLRLPTDFTAKAGVKCLIKVSFGRKNI